MSQPLSQAAVRFYVYIASGKVMQKAGMQFVTKHSARYEKNGEIFDADEYMISSEAWKQT